MASAVSRGEARYRAGGDEDIIISFREGEKGRLVNHVQSPERDFRTAGHKTWRAC